MFCSLTDLLVKYLIVLAGEPPDADTNLGSAVPVLSIYIHNIIHIINFYSYSGYIMSFPNLWP